MKKLFTSLFLILLSGFIMQSYGQTENNNSALDIDTLMFEEFNYTTGVLPPNWFFEGQEFLQAGEYVWTVADFNMAGGKAPELGLNFGLLGGDYRMISPTISVDGYQRLCLKYNQYLINYSIDYGEVISFDVSFDGGENWESLWGQPLGLVNIPQDEVSYYITVPEGATEMQFAFHYSGSYQNINWWVIDNLALVTVPDNDLLAVDILVGNTVVKAGEENMYLVEVKNVGKLEQSDFTVRLVHENGDILGTSEGSKLAYNESGYYMFMWTPEEALIDSSFSVYADVVFSNDENTENNRTNKIIVNVSAANIADIMVAEGSVPVEQFPYDFNAEYSLSQTCYSAEQLVAMKDHSVTAIEYTCQFDEDVSVPIQIYLGETNKTDLSEGWVDPSAFTLVYDDIITFTKGMHETYIKLDNAYSYKGGNLVVYSNKGGIADMMSTPFISTLDTANAKVPCRFATRNELAFNPMTLPYISYEWYYSPNISFYYSSNISSKEVIHFTSDILVYPNPASNVLNVKSDETIREIIMKNSSGQVLYRQTLSDKEHTIDLNGFSPGLYFVDVVKDEGTESKKIIISK